MIYSQLIKTIHFAVFVLIAAVTAVSGQQELKTAETVSFTLSSEAPVVQVLRMEKHQVARLEFTHRSTTLYIRVVAPSGRTVITKVAPTLFNGTGDLFFSVAEKGTHRLIFSSERPGKTVGTIDVVLREVRAVQASDEYLLRAHRLMSEADDLRAKLRNIDADRSTRQQALAKYEEAVKLFNEAKDLRSAAGAHLRLGDFQSEEFDFFKLSEAQLDKAVAIYDGLGDLNGATLARVIKLFPVLFSRGNTPDMLALLEECLKGVEKLGDPVLKGRFHVIQSRSILRTGDVPKAIEAANSQISLAGQMDFEGRLWAENALLSIGSAIGDRRLETVSRRAGLQAYNENRGKVHPRWALNPKFTQALTVFYGGQKRGGEKLLAEVLVICERLGRERQLAFYLREVGELYTREGLFARAKLYLLRSLELYDRVSPYEAQGIYNALGLLYMKTGELPKAKALFVRAVEKNRVNGDPFAEANSLANLAVAQRMSGESEAALESINSALSMGLAHFARLSTRASRMQFSTSILRTYSEIKISILHSLYANTRSNNYVEEAFLTQEMVHARMLLEVVSDSGFKETTTSDPNLFSQLDSILARISQLDAQRRRSSTKANSNETEITKLILEYERVDTEIRNLNPRRENLTNPKLRDISDVRRLLDSDTAMVVYSLGNNESFVWVVTSDGISVRTLSSRKDITDAVEKYVAASAAPPGVDDRKLLRISRRLGEMVLSPIWRDIAPYKRLLIVPDESLGLVSFDSLNVPAPHENDFLVATHETAILPSASTLVALRDAKSRSPGPDGRNLLAIMADPVFDSSDERLKSPGRVTDNRSNSTELSRTLPDFSIRSLTRLPFTNVEARRIAGVSSGRARVFSGTEATRQRLIGGELSDYRIIHFATHGFLNDLHPELSGIVLSLYDSSGNPRDGFLRAVDLYSIKLNADLVVLSGCKTASGNALMGEGMIGVTRGFMYAGVPSIVASLWDVDDSVTSYFMEKFYEGLLVRGMKPSAALRDVKLQMLSSPRFKSPKYWAGFTLQGEYDVTFK